MSTNRSPAVADLPDALRALIAIAPTAGVFTDFDGTLSEIVEHHEDAQAVDGASNALRALAERFAVVAVVSGRDTRALSMRLRAPGVRLFGAYGLEERVGRRTIGIPEAEEQRPAIRRVTRRIRAAADTVPGVAIESKGLATAVHFRPAPDPEAAQRMLEPIVHELAASERLDVMVGKQVLEFRPRVPIDKGRRVRALIHECSLRGALVAGDDHGDIAMFDALGELDLAFRIAVAGHETPQGLLDRADLVVGSPGGLVALLRAVASA